MSTAHIVPGSLKAIARDEGKSLAESFLSADAIIVVDVSGSMGLRDVDTEPRKARASWEEGITGITGRSRYEAALEELARLQASLPGKIAVVAFSGAAQFCWGGQPPFLMGGTDLKAALRFIQPADGCGMRLIIISDGHPDDADAALRVARQFQTALDTVYIGPPGGAGAAFLRQLAQVSGGAYQQQRVDNLAASVAGLLTSGRAA